MTAVFEQADEQQAVDRIGHRLFELREAAGLSQRQVALRGDGSFSQASVSNYETGRRTPTFVTIVRMVQAIKGGSSRKQVGPAIVDFAMEVIECGSVGSTQD